MVATNTICTRVGDSQGHNSCQYLDWSLATQQLPETAAGHTKASPSTHASDDTAATSSSKTTSKTMATDSASRGVEATTGTSRTTSKATAIDTASQDVTSRDRCLAGYRQGNADSHRGPALRQQNPAPQRLQASHRRPRARESTQQLPPAPLELPHLQAQHPPRLPLRSTRSSRKRTRRKSRPSIRRFHKMSSPWRTVKGANHCLTILVPVSRNSRRTLLCRKRTRKARQRENAEKEENGDDDDDDDDDDKRHNCDKDDVECIVGATLGSVVGGGVISVGVSITFTPKRP